MKQIEPIMHIMQSNKNHKIDVTNMRQLAINAIEFCLNSSVPLPVILNNIYDVDNATNMKPNSDDNRENIHLAQEYSLQEKAFCTQLIYGYFRHAGLLRLALRNFVKRPQDLPQDCLLAFYLGAYEILFLQNRENQKDATYATLFEYVEIVKKWYGKDLAGLTNAVLRNIQRQKQDILTSMESAQKSYLAPISSNQIPSKKSIRHMHELADLAPIFTHEINPSFLQSIVEDSFFPPAASYRINTKFKHKLLEKLEQFEFENDTQNKESYTIAATDYSCFEDICLHSSNSKAQKIKEQEKDYQEDEYQEREHCRKEYLRCIKEWEKEGIITRQGIGSQLLVKKIASFLKQNVFIEISPDSFAKANSDNFVNESSNNLPKSSPLIWDACCGRGGKSSALIEMGIPVHLCSDPNIERLTYAKKNLNRLNLLEENEKNNPIFHVSVAQKIANFMQEYDAANTSLDNSNAEENKPKENARVDNPKEENTNGGLAHIASEKFSCVLLDSPCSTSGTLARNPEVKHRINKETLEAVVHLQAELLHTTWQCLKPKGYLIYVTCSLFSKENEQQIKNFMDTHTAHLVEQNYIIPHKINADFKGHDILFYAILQKIT